MTDLTFVHLSDLHIMPSADDELKDQRTGDKLRGVIRRIRNMEISPDFFILSGDLANDGGEAEYQRLNTLLDELRDFGAPLILGRRQPRSAPPLPPRRPRRRSDRRIAALLP